MSRRPSAALSADRSVRSLARLEASGSTTRSLNLVAIWKRHGAEADYQARPFFQNPTLNRAMVLKHRMRGHESDILMGLRSNATKIVLPIDVTDLRAGARSFFVGEPGYRHQLESIWRSEEAGRTADLELLELLDTLPSFDPFLMRERLSRAGYHPARCYFDLSEADAARMLGSVRQEVMPLVGRSFDGGGGLAEKTAKLAAKLMSNAGDADLEPLRMGMGMGRADFEEGVFCWKGFIYYKWMLSQLMPQAGPAIEEIGSVKPKGWSREDIVAITAAQACLTRTVMRSFQKVRATLGVYESAYAELTEGGKPTRFRDFLLQAPSLFYEMGERLGAVQHMVSFWRYRFPTAHRITLSAEDMIDLLADFQASLGADDGKDITYLPMTA